MNKHTPRARRLNAREEQLVKRKRRIKDAGVSSKFIYRQTGISDKTVSAWRTGKVGEPRFSRGLALLKLHQRFCPEQHARQIYERA